MPRYDPFTATTPLPRVGEEYERATCDLKLSGELTTAFHRGKDIAAFANHLGGTVLVGFGEANGRVGALVPMTEADMHRVSEDIASAVEQRCSPLPVVESVPLRGPNGGFLLAVNVEPHLTALVGVKVDSLKPAEGYGGPAYVFPMRTMTQTTFLTPEQLVMYMTPEVRRAVILLNKIPSGERVRVVILGSSEMRQAQHVDAKMGNIDEASNAAVFTDWSGKPPSATTVLKTSSVPLDCIRTVVREAEGWLISVRPYK